MVRVKLEDREMNSETRVHVEINGVTVLVNATSEGIIVDVMSNGPDSEVLSTMCCEYPEIEE